MSGNNMENLLLGGDDSSSGDESDHNNNTKASVTAAALSQQQQRPNTAIAQQQPPLQQQQLPQSRPLPHQTRPSPQQQQQRLPPPQMQQQQHSMPPQMQKASEMTMRLQQQMYVAPGVGGGVHSALPPTAAAGPFVVAGNSSAGPRQPTLQQQQARAYTAQPPQQQQQHRLPPPVNNNNDPYAPTPVNQIIERHQQKQNMQQQQQMRANTTHTNRAPSSASSSSSSTTTLPISNTTSDSNNNNNSNSLALIKKQKEQFIIFTRVLMKYLETKDPPLHLKVKAIIKDCAERNKRQERGYESVTASMKTRLQQVVGDAYWKRAEAYLAHFLKEKERKAELERMKHASSGGGGGGGMSQQQQQQGKSSGGGNGAPQQQQAAAMRPGGAPPPSTMAAMRQDMEQRKQALAAAAGSSTTTTGKSKSSSAGGPKAGTTAAGPQSFTFKNKTAGAAAATASGNASGKTTPTQGKRTSPAGKKSTAEANSANAPASNQQQQQPAPPKEYNEFMEMIDHAVDFDWTTAGLIMGRQQLPLEAMVVEDLLMPHFQQEPSFYGQPFPIPNWTHRNVVSSRTAWACVRLPELTRQDRLVGNDDSTTLAAPIPGQSVPTIPRTAWNTWHNEDVAEDDVVLAVISEGCQVYLKSILEKAIHCSRQRQNLDGTRLWYKQCSSIRSSQQNPPPPLSLRLGCDVRRQWARTSGNDALICKRMEQALERQERVPQSARALKQETLEQESSMSSLALRPKLAQGVEDAETQAKRCFEVYGGKDASEPVFDRVTKRPKLELIDFELGMELQAVGGSRQRKRGRVAALDLFV